MPSAVLIVGTIHRPFVCHVTPERVLASGRPYGFVKAASTALASLTAVLDRPPSAAATNLIAGTVTKYLVLPLNIGLGIVLMPFTVRHLGQTDYGLWMLVASMTTYFQLLDLGYGNGI